MAKTERVTLRMSQGMLRKVERLQKKLKHRTVSQTLRHLANRGLKTYAGQKEGKRKEEKRSEVL